MLTREAQEARKKEVETREAHFELQKKQKAEKYAKKVEKQEEEKRKQEAASAAEVAKANYELKRLSAVLASKRAEGKTHGAPCVLCGIYLPGGKANDLGEKWEEGWTACTTKNCNEAWCSDCIKMNPKAYSNHRQQKHPPKSNKRKDPPKYRAQEAQVEAARAKFQKLVEAQAKAKQQNGYDAGEVTADAQFPPQILHPIKSVDQLLVDPEFREVVANALEVPEITTKEFTPDELVSAKSVVEVMRCRYFEKLGTQSAAVKADVLWQEYVEPNLPRIVAIKVLQGIVDLNRRGLLSTTKECLLLPPDQSTIKEIFKTSPRNQSWGSYLVLSDGKFRRSGKAIDSVQRLVQHNTARKKWEASCKGGFYQQCHEDEVWDKLRFFDSLAIKDQKNRATLARCMIITDAFNSQHLLGMGNGRKWGTKSTNVLQGAEDRKMEFVAYLSEFADDLMLNPDDSAAWTSSIGFESPLIKLL